MGNYTTISVLKETRIDLESFKGHKKESIDEVIKGLIAFKRAHAPCPSEPPPIAGRPETTQ